MGEARSWKSALRSAAKGALLQQGWSPGSGSGVFVTSTALVEPPLEAEWSVEVDGNSYGGASISGQGRLRSAEVCSALAGMNPAAMTSQVEKPRFGDTAGAVAAMSLELVTVGGLVDPGGNYTKWSVLHDEELAAATEAYNAVVEGPLREWLARRSSVDGFLDLAAAGQARVQSESIRTVSVVAVQHGRAEVARSWLAGYALPQRGDSEERIALFERELQRILPAYGDLQRS